MIKTIAGVMLVFSLSLASAEDHAAFTFPRSTPEAQGVSSSAILDFVETADQTVHDMHSFMVMLSPKDGGHLMMPQHVTTCIRSARASRPRQRAWPLRKEISHSMIASSTFSRTTFRRNRASIFGLCEYEIC